MKLLRLTTENNKAYFESVFNSDLVIKPYSKIALSSFTTQLNNLNMIIDAQNNEMTFGVDGDNNVKIINLPNGTYVSSTIGEFWRMVTQIFNKSMVANSKEVNRQWFCGIDGGRVVFKLRYGTRIFPKNATSVDLIVAKNIQQGQGQGVLKKSTSGISNDAFMYFKSPNNKGVSILRATLNADTVGGVVSGFVLGYTASNPLSSATIIDPATFLYGIRYVDLAQPYKYIVNGVDEVGDFSPVIGDTIELIAYGGTLFYLLYRNNSTDAEVIHSVDYDHITNLFPLCLFVGADTVMSGIQFTTDPWYDINTTHGGEIITAVNPNIISIPTTKDPTDCFLLFNNPDLGSIFGFNNNRYPTSGFNSVAEPEFIANVPFELRDYSESYIIELLNIKLESMCSLSGGQRNFLYVIPQLSAIKEHVVFQVPQLIFLNMNNSTEINLREVRARVLKDNLGSITCYGLSELVIIIKDKDEI
jgi:hypothetical protein